MQKLLKIHAEFSKFHVKFIKILCEIYQNFMQNSLKY